LADGDLIVLVFALQLHGRVYDDEILPKGRVAYIARLVVVRSAGRGSLSRFVVARETHPFSTRSHHSISRSFVPNIRADLVLLLFSILPTIIPHGLSACLTKYAFCSAICAGCDADFESKEVRVVFYRTVGAATQCNNQVT